MQRIALTLIFLSLAISGCGSVTISGTVSLPAGFTAAAPTSCADIGVSAFTRFLDGKDEIATVKTTGDIASGHCEFVLTVPAGKSMQIGSPPYDPSDLHFTDCPATFRTTFITEQSVFFVVPGAVTLNLDMAAPHPCP